jgi:hypothetical protein
MSALSIPIGDSVTAFWILHFDIVKFMAGDGTGPHLHAVLPANNNTLKMLIPSINSGRADQSALFFFTPETFGRILYLQMGLLIHFILIEKQFVFNTHDFIDHAFEFAAADGRLPLGTVGDPPQWSVVTWEPA